MYKIMTYEEAIEHCHKHRNEYIREFEVIEEGIESFNSLITLLEDEVIKTSELPDYGMEIPMVEITKGVKFKQNDKIYYGKTFNGFVFTIAEVDTSNKCYKIKDTGVYKDISIKFEQEHNYNLF